MNSDDIRGPIQVFAKHMEQQMRKHDKTKGDSWMRCHSDFFVFKLGEEINEVLDAIKNGTGSEVWAECADAANVLMMLAHAVSAEKAAVRFKWGAADA